LVEKVHGLIHYFRSNINVPDHMLLPSTSPIQGIVMDGNAKVNALSQRLIKAGLNVKPIRFPTVPKGKERVRICLHSHNTQEQVQQLIQIVQTWFRENGIELLENNNNDNSIKNIKDNASHLNDTRVSVPLTLQVPTEELEATSRSSTPTSALSVSTLSAISQQLTRAKL
ncbi:5-aminolevulinate synthase, nonspecific, mitochondrial, partial [Mortierella antarctica]